MESRRHYSRERGTYVILKGKLLTDVAAVLTPINLTAPNLNALGKSAPAMRPKYLKSKILRSLL
jgi:hypothetical protein